MSHVLAERLTALKRQLDAEAAERAKIESSPEFASLKSAIEELQAKQNAMLSGVPNSMEDYQAAKQDMISIMASQGLEKIENVVARFKEKKEVNKGKVLHVIGGDMDIFVTLSNITQIALKDFAKVSPDLKKELLGCIEVTDKEIIDVNVIDDQSAAA